MATPLAYLEGKYEILEKISEGGMGAIYKVRHRLLDEIRVVKVMHPQHEHDEGLKARFLHEARMAVKLRHANIAQMYDFAVDEGGNAFIVMEYIEGITLQEMLERIGPPPIGLALELARQTLSALGYLHRKGIVHRDMAPDNVMAARDEAGHPQAKLIDLGIAKVLKGSTGLTVTGMFVGKLRYSSPEQFRSEPGVTVDERSDVYSFGVVLYELLTGKHPISGTSPQALIAGHLVNPPASFAQTDPHGRVPRELREITLKAMAKQPEERFQNADAFSRALAEIAARHPLEIGEFERAMDLPEMPTQRIVLARPGSTQSRLDQQFRMTATPAPDSLPPVVPAPTAVPVPSPPTLPPQVAPPHVEDPPVRSALAEAAEAVTGLIGDGKLDLAAQRLEAAQARHGEQSELIRLRGELDQALAAQREARVQGLVAEARELTSGGRHAEAVRRLEQAKAISPGDPTVGSLLAHAVTQLQVTQEPSAAGPAPPVESPPPPAASREDVPGSKPSRWPMPVLVGVAGLVIATAVLAIIVIGRGAKEPATAPTPVPQVPTAVVAPTPSGPTATEMLSAAEAALGSGDLPAAEAELDRLEGLEEGSLGQDEQERLAKLREALAGQRGKNLTRDLERALAAGSLDRLLRLLAGVGDQERAAAEGDPRLAKALRDAGVAAEAYSAMIKAGKEKRPFDVVRHAGSVLAVSPKAAQAAQARAEAAASIEAQAEAALGAGQAESAIAQLEKLSAAWPDRAGLSGRLDAARGTQQRDRELASVVARAVEAEQQGRPDRALEILSTATPSGRWEATFRETRARQEQRLSELDKAPPTLQLRAGFKLEYEKGKGASVPVRCADDFGVKEVTAFGRVAGAPGWDALPVRVSQGGEYLIEVGPAFHHNEDVELYVQAADASGHITRLGSRETPLKLKRKRWPF